MRVPGIFFGLAPFLNVFRGLVAMQGSHKAFAAAVTTATLAHRLGSWDMCCHFALSAYLFNVLVVFGVHIQVTTDYNAQHPVLAYTACSIQYEVVWVSPAGKGCGRY